MSKTKTQTKNSTATAAPTKTELRIKIANDVIASIRAERYNARNGDYTPAKISDAFCVAAYGADGDPKDVCNVISKSHKCGVCAVGALMLSTMRKDSKRLADLVGQQDSGPIDDINDGIAYLSDIFNNNNLHMMEFAFEFGGGYVQLDDLNLTRLSTADRIGLALFGVCYKDSNDRLVAIMKNVVRNNGTFRPGDEATVSYDFEVMLACLTALNKSAKQDELFTLITNGTLSGRTLNT